MPERPQKRLRDLTFSGAKVMSYYVERSDSFFARYGADQSNAKLGDITGDDLVFAEVDFQMDDLSPSEYADLMKRMGNHLQSVHLATPVRGFSVLGQLPAKILTFDSQIDKVTAGFEELAGSLSLFRINTTPVMRIK